MSDSRMMVMVASLERHLEEERKILTEAIIGQNGLPVGLAYPPIPANYIYKLNMQCISDADYVMLLIGTEYGALSDQGVGLLHATYAAAQAARKPIVSLVYKGENWHSTDQFDKKRLQGFVDQVKTGCVYYWHDWDSLRDNAEQALEYIYETYPSVGWVKADLQPLIPVSSEEDQNLIQKLKTQVSHLKHKIQRLSTDESVAEVSFEKDQSPWLVQYQCNAFREGRLKQVNGTLSFNLTDAFEWLSASLLSPMTEAKLKAVISGKIHNAVLANAQATWHGCHAVSDIKISQGSFDDLKKRFRALSIITFDPHGRWQLTQAGEQVALQRES